MTTCASLLQRPTCLAVPFATSYRSLGACDLPTFYRGVRLTPCTLPPATLLLRTHLRARRSYHLPFTVNAARCCRCWCLAVTTPFTTAPLLHTTQHFCCDSYQATCSFTTSYVAPHFLPLERAAACRAVVNRAPGVFASSLAKRSPRAPNTPHA